MTSQKSLTKNEKMAVPMPTMGTVSNRPYGVIYKITNSINGKIYIGQTRATFEARWKGHILASRKKSCSYSHLHAAIRKYGQGVFRVEQIDSADSEKNLHAKEIFWIAHFNSTDKHRGYNRNRGGSGKPQEMSTRQKLSEYRKRAWQDPEYRTKMAMNDARRDQLRQTGKAFFQTPAGEAYREMVRQRFIKIRICPQCQGSFNGQEWRWHTATLTKCREIPCPPREKTKLAIAARAHTSEEKSRKFSARWTPEMRQQWSEKMKAIAAANSQGREKCSKASREWWRARTDWSTAHLKEIA